MTEATDPFDHALAEIMHHKEQRQKETEILQQRRRHFEGSWVQTINQQMSETNPRLKLHGIQFTSSSNPQDTKLPSHTIGILAHSAAGQRLPLPTLTFFLMDADLVLAKTIDRKFERLLGISDQVPVDAIRQTMAAFLAMVFKAIPG